MQCTFFQNCFLYFAHSIGLYFYLLQKSITGQLLWTIKNYLLQIYLIERCFKLMFRLLQGIIHVVPIFSLLSLFWEKKFQAGLWDHLDVYMSVCSPSQPLNAWTNFYDTWYMYHGTWAQLTSVFHEHLPSFCLCVYSPLSFLGNGLARTWLQNECTCNNRRLVEYIVLYVVRVVPKESLWVCVCITLLLLGSGSVNTFLWQQIHTQQ
jgi:hypothetical protein